MDLLSINKIVSTQSKRTQRPSLNLNNTVFEYIISLTISSKNFSFEKKTFVMDTLKIKWY